MKLLSVAIPCYNSAEYMGKAIESCLVFGDRIEIIIVDDGSQKDNTQEIGKMYESKYPDIVKYVYQENGGHGQAVNTGLENATGVYFKVLDSDDWLDKNSLLKVKSTMEQFEAHQKQVDMIICNYVYEKTSENKSKVIKYTNIMPQNKVFTWSDTNKFLPHQNLLMHSLIYRTQLLRDCGIKLPKHTFYVDNIFAYQPLPYVKTMYYMDLDLYRYYIGREGQSVNEKIMISRIDQQLRVNKIMIDCCDIMSLQEEKCRDYMVKYLTMITTVSTVLLIKSGTTENLSKKYELWNYLKNKDIKLYNAVKHSFLGRCMQLDSAIGKKLVTAGYSISQKIFGFN